MLMLGAAAEEPPASFFAHFLLKDGLTNGQITVIIKIMNMVQFLKLIFCRSGINFIFAILDKESLSYRMDLII